MLAETEAGHKDSQQESVMRMGGILEMHNTKILATNIK